jgi:hypothetical protein
MDVWSIDWSEMFPYFFVLFATFGAAFCLWTAVFSELDYYEIKYTRKTKRRTLLVIWSNLFLIIIWFNVIRKAVASL